MKTLTENQIAAGLLNDFIDAEHLEYFHLKSIKEVKQKSKYHFRIPFYHWKEFLLDFSKSLDSVPWRQSRSTDSVSVCGVVLTEPLSRSKSEPEECYKTCFICQYSGCWKRTLGPTWARTTRPQHQTWMSLMGTPPTSPTWTWASTGRGWDSRDQWSLSPPAPICPKHKATAMVSILWLSGTGIMLYSR